MFCSIRWLCLFLLMGTMPLLSIAENADPTSAYFHARELRCEGRIHPLGVESPTPRLSWSVSASGRNAYQAACRVLVASRPELLRESVGDLWDSEKLYTGDQHITYAGRPLHSLDRAYWRVQLWDRSDQLRENAEYETGEFTLGLLNEKDWKASWITDAERSSTAQSPLPIFRKTFMSASKPIQRAMVHCCGLGHFELFLNGAKVGDHVFDPGWTDYKDTGLYVPFDVTSHIVPGNNALGVMLGNGLYNVIGGRYVKFTGSFGPPKLILQLHVFFEDGTEEIIVSDESWITHEGPILFSCPYGGEDYDARREMPGWNQPEFNAENWSPARVVEGPGGVLRAQNIPPIKVLQTLQPVTLSRIAPGQYEADMGYNLSARPRIKVRGKAGDQVVIRLAERAGQPWEGHSYTYTLRGDTEEIYTPYFTYFGFQYIQVEGADCPADADGGRPALLEVASEFVTSSASETGSFECGNELLNQIHDMIGRSVRSNLQSVLTDCPHREKLGWLEVAHLMGPSILYHFDARELYRKICRDTSESQLENGLVPDIAPEYTRFSQGFFESAEWGSAAVQLPWLLYRWYGNPEILSRQYETMKRYTDYLATTRNEQGLAKAGLGDWYDWTPEKGHAGYAQLTPGELTATAMLFDNARILGETALLLSHASDAERYRLLAAQVRDDFMNAYYDATNHTVATGSQSALSVGLFFHLVPEADRPAVLANLVKTVEADAFKPSTGEVCFRYMLLALAGAGRSDVVYRILNRTDCPGYGWMLTEFGLKTLSECWDKPGSSLNHCMFGHAQEWFQAYLLGIRQAEDSVGFKQLLIAPQPQGDMTHASGHFDSPRGTIRVSWKREKTRFEMEATLPGNTSAEVVLPVPAGCQIFESGKPIQDSDDIQFIAQQEDGYHYRVHPGTYQFTCPFIPNDIP